VAWRWSKDKFIRYEYGRQFQHANRINFAGKHDPDAHMALFDVLKSKKTWVQACYSNVDAEYDIQYSTLHPFYEPFQKYHPSILDVNPVPVGSRKDLLLEWERWLYNPPAITNLIFTGVNVWSKIGSFPVRGTYYHVTSRGGWWSDSPVATTSAGTPAFDDLWAIWVYVPATKTVNVYFVYGQQMRSGGAFPGADPADFGDQRLLMMGMDVNF
jgi:hypothetical protein